MTEHELEIAFELMGSRLKGGGKNRVAQCPLAQWTHTKGIDKNPSLTATADSIALYKCWSCGNAGSVKKLTRMYAEYSGDSRAYDFVRNIEGEHVNLWKPVTRKFEDYQKHVGKRIQKNAKKIVSEDDLKRFLKAVPEYAYQRGLTNAQVNKWQIGFDERETRMIVPVRDHTGKLVGVSGRALMEDQQPKWKHYWGFKKELVLFGEQFRDQTKKRAYIVEGFLDVFHLERFKCPNALAAMGTSLSFDQMKKLSSWFDEVVFIPDCDDKGAGLKFNEEFAERLVLSSGMRAGVAGTVLNDKFVKRYRANTWEPIDYRLEPIPEMWGKDPADMSHGDLLAALNSICWFEFKQGDIHVEGGHVNQAP